MIGPLRSRYGVMPHVVPMLLRLKCSSPLCLYGGRDQHGHVLGTTARHHAVDGDVPGYRSKVGLRQDGYLLVRRPVCVPEELFDPLSSRRDDRQTVRPFVSLEMVVHIVEGPATHNLLGVKDAGGARRDWSWEFPAVMTPGAGASNDRPTQRSGQARIRKRPEKR